MSCRRRIDGGFLWKCHDLNGGTFRSGFIPYFATTLNRFVLIARFAAFIARIGFILMQIGCTPVENVTLLILENVIDILMSVSSFLFFGYTIAFGEQSVYGLFAYQLDSNGFEERIPKLTKGLGASLLSSGILRTFLAGRLKIFSVIVTTIMYNILMQAVVMHWIWNPVGFVSSRGYLMTEDNAVVVHISPCVVGLIGSIILGRRVIKLDEMDRRSMPKSMIGFTVLSYFMVLFGFIYYAPLDNAYNCPSHVAMVLLKNVFAMAGGLLSWSIFNAVLHRSNFANYWPLMQCLQGGIAGVVSLSAEIVHYNVVIAFCLGFTISFLAAVIAYFVHRSSLEDNCNLMAVHFTCALLSSLFVTYFATDVAIVDHLWQILWQFVSIAAVIVWHCLVSTIMFGLLSFLGLLRNSFEEKNHERALVLKRYYKRRFCKRIFSVNRNSMYLTPDDITEYKSY